MTTSIDDLARGMRVLQKDVRDMGAAVAIVSNKMTALETRRDITLEKERAAEERLLRHSERIRAVELDTQAIKTLGPKMTALSDQLEALRLSRAKFIGWVAGASAVGGVVTAVVVGLVTHYLTR